MNITQEKIDNLNSVVKVSIKPEDYRDRVEKAIKSQAKKAKLPGFRPGMVPPSHIKKMYGKSILVDEINNLLNDSLNNYITENKLDVLGQPLPKVDESKEFNWDYNDEFEFDYELGLAPEFELSFSEKDTLPYYQIKIDAETLESRVKNIRKSYGKMTNPEVSAEDDILYSELTQLSPDGSVFEGGISSTASVRLDLIKDEEIKKALIGLKKDDVTELDIQKAFANDAAQISKLLNIGEDDARDLQSKFRLTVKNVNRLEEADLDQEFFDKLFGKDAVKTEEEFKEKITAELESMVMQNADQKLNNDIIGFGLQKFNLELPDEFLKRWLKATNQNITEEELENGYSDFARNLRWTLIENKLMKENSLEVKYEDVFEAAKQRLDAQFRMYSPQALPEDQLAQYTVQFLQNKENANKVFEDVKTAKVLDYLKTVITLDKKEIEYNKFLELN
ncbi:trigger factor [Arcticibacter tournemirensis]|uniref:Trigger factor n=1 Tax=Arcticibacter tournemirensis TaxID=699437 RepID=A0A5M9HBQ5_9SPHI|nr:trigger factor [Arcticibacter tournemirensis]KAA8483839.1 trigger factor [Arcticibacter tournemirensis]TQM49945.1 trigger factor [Arcticibacter tournemirensis]